MRVVKIPETKYNVSKDLLKELHKLYLDLNKQYK
jgi:hypothetical protein